MVASVHELASQAGVQIMKAGGNAVDAAVATGFALAVVYPQAGNIGGGGFMLIRMADGATHFLDYREKAPAAATRDMYLDKNGNVVANASLIGYKAIGVPGSVAGLTYAEKKYGKLTLAQVMAPAIKLAREGFVLSCRRSAGAAGSCFWPNFPSRTTFFSATATSTRRATYSASRNWPALWSASPPIRTISITAPWRASSPLPCSRAAA